MKKLCLLLLSFVFLSSACYATSHCQNQAQYSKAHQTVKNCPKKQEQHCSGKFLCTNRNMSNLFHEMRLSDTQICTATKINDKYTLEVLSLNERIQCEHQNLYVLKQKCAKNSEIRKQKRLIKRLEKDRKKICKNYECQFKAILSDDQKKAYKKYKKCK